MHANKIDKPETKTVSMLNQQKNIRVYSRSFADKN